MIKFLSEFANKFLEVKMNVGFNLLAEDTNASESINWSAVWEVIINWITTTGIKLIIAIVLLFVSFKLVNFLTKRLYNRLHKKNFDETITKVGTTALKWGLKIIILVTLIGYVGIETASISAVIASLGVGISLAVQGALSNFAGGLIIIVMRPFKIGDYIKSNGEEGTVEDIKPFYTHIVTPDNRAIMIPNGSLANNVIVNNSAKDSRRLDFVFGVSYKTDIDKAKKLLAEICENCQTVFTTPAPFISVGALSNNAVNVYVRVWCKNSEYWPTNFYLLDTIKKAFDENGIEIAFNQLDVNLNQPKLPEYVTEECEKTD